MLTHQSAEKESEIRNVSLAENWNQKCVTTKESKICNKILRVNEALKYGALIKFFWDTSDKSKVDKI
jgi:hypothetical protein